MFTALLARVARGMRAHGIPYLVMGGQAVLVYGEPRLTRDIDITLGLDVDELPRVEALMRDVGLSPLVDAATFVPETMVLPCADEVSGIRVDLVFSFSAFEQQAIARAVTRTIEGEAVHFVSVEDLVVQKLVAGRARDLEDARGLLLRNPDMDRGHILHWLQAFQDATAEPLLERLRSLESEG